MSFLAPLLLAGVALAAVPWWLHRIRRPERDVVAFPSLMFVPEARREVIERRRVQHVALMLLRMGLLALLALAFARPFQRVLAGTPAATGASGDHVFLVDVSASMAPHLDDAVAAARTAIDDLPADSRVAVATFARTTAVRQPLSDGAGTASRSGDAVRALDNLRVTTEHTDLVQALQAAERILIGAADGPDLGASRLRVVHLVSDLQATGLPDGALSWQLAGGVQLDLLPVGGDTTIGNTTVEAIAVQTAGERLVVRARIRHRGSGTRPVTARLWIDGDQRGATALTVPPGNATLAVFEIERPARATGGRVTLDAGDGLAADDARFFALNPAAQRTVLLLDDGSHDAAVLRAALPASTDLPWRLAPVSGSASVDSLAATPAAVLVGDPGRQAPSTRTALRRYLEQGGALLLVPPSTADLAPLADLLGPDPALRVDGTADLATPAGLAWVDLGHPVFQPFRTPRYNDFSTLRVRGFHRLVIQHGDTVTQLARFGDDDASPAILEVGVDGGGRVVVWAAGIDRAWSDLTRDRRFVPLLHETLRHLAGETPADPTPLVGDRLARAQPRHAGSGAWQLARLNAAGRGDGDPFDLDATSTARFSEPGLYGLRRKGTARWQRLTAVNLDPREGDLRSLTPDELRLRVAGGAAAPVAAGAAADGALADDTVRVEWGRAVLVALLLALAGESWLARRIARREAA